MKRPKVITVFCVLGYLSIMFSFPQVFSPEVKKAGLFMPAFSGFLVAANFMAYVGLWYMKRWGAELFLISYFLKTILDLLQHNTGFLFYFGQIFSILMIVFLLKHLPKLSRNL